MDPAERSTLIETLLVRVRAGEPGASDALLQHVYDELRDLARRCFADQPGDHTLQPTILVHEAYTRMVRSDEGWRDRAHFFAVAATAMRQLLISHARRRHATKRGGQRSRLTLDRVVESAAADGVEFTVLDDLLVRLADLNARQARVVELRVFGGLTVEETAHVLGVGETTVKNEWQFARAWLARELMQD